MKKIKYLLLSIFVFLFSIGTVSAYDYEMCERNEENNYGVNKKWELNSSKIYYAKTTPCVDASKKIHDFSDILYEDEEEQLNERIKELSEKYNLEIVILTYDLPYTYDAKNEEFATDFYDFNDFGIDLEGYSGVLLFRNTYSEDPYFDMYSFGPAQLYLTPNRMNNILNYNDELYNYLHNKEYLSGFNEWLDTIEDCYNSGIEEGYHVIENGKVVKNFNPFIVGNLVITSIITLIFIIVNVKKNKMVYTAIEANAYFNKESFILTKDSDRLVSSHTTSYTESDYSSSSGHSGGHSSMGHSGGFHSSGGGRHG